MEMVIVWRAGQKQSALQSFMEAAKALSFHYARTVGVVSA